MKKSAIQMKMKMTVSCLFLLLFFGSVNVFAFTHTVSEQTLYAQVFTEEVEQPTELPASDGILDKKSFIETDGAPAFEKDDDNILKGPPTFDDDDLYPPGGQVNPKLPLGGGLIVLLALAGVYTFIRKRKR